jgi:hypothetical protein
MPETDRTEGRTDAPFTENATGAESTYVHGGQRPLENPPRSGAADVSMPVQDELNEMHVDSKLQSGQVVKPVALATDNDEFGRTPEQMKELNTKREEAFKTQDGTVEARNNHIEALADVNNIYRDRTLAVQEEIATRERDGAMPGTPAFERRKARIRDIVGQTEKDEEAREKDHGDRLQVIAAGLHNATPAGIEDAERQLMALAADMHGDKDGSKAAKARSDARIKADQDRLKEDQKVA